MGVMNSRLSENFQRFLSYQLKFRLSQSPVNFHRLSIDKEPPRPSKKPLLWRAAKLVHSFIAHWVN